MNPKTPRDWALLIAEDRKALQAKLYRALNTEKESVRGCTCTHSFLLKGCTCGHIEPYAKRSRGF